MDNESKFWIAVNAIVGAAFLGAVYLGTSYWSDHNRKIVELIGTGVDPVAAMCAMQDDYGDHPTCVILATKSK